MEIFITGLVWVFDKVWPVPVMLLGLAFLISVIGPHLGIPSHNKVLVGAVYALVICVPFGTPIVWMFGSIVTAPLIYHFGEPGQAVIVDSEETNNMMNEQWVERYFVKLQKADGTQIDTQFDSSDFNVYPRRNRVRYPSQGEPFAVHYLPKRPQSFVILMPEAEGKR